MAASSVTAARQIPFSLKHRCNMGHRSFDAASVPGGFVVDQGPDKMPQQSASALVVGLALFRTAGFDPLHTPTVAAEHRWVGVAVEPRLHWGCALLRNSALGRFEDSSQAQFLVWKVAKSLYLLVEGLVEVRAAAFVGQRELDSSDLRRIRRLVSAVA